MPKIPTSLGRGSSTSTGVTGMVMVVGDEEGDGMELLEFDYSTGVFYMADKQYDQVMIKKKSE